MNLPKTLDPTKIPIRASTQEHLDIEDIQEGIVILKDGSCCLAILTTAINFGLLSEKEQEATIYAYAGLLNSLTFSIQIVIRSQRKDISAYLRLLQQAEEKEGKKEIKTQIQQYRQFIQETIAKNNVLDKKFYLVIPMSSLELGAKQVLTSTFAKKKGLPFDKSYILQRAKTNLYPRRDHLLRQLNRSGLKGRQLKTRELVQLFFNVYNPEVKGQQLVSSKEYQTPLVEPITAKVKKTPPPNRPLENITETKVEPPLSQGEIKVETKPIQPADTPGVQPQKGSIQEQINGLVQQSINNKDHETTI
jgi:hypothetical protein